MDYELGTWEALLQANVSLCRVYGLGFYQGSDSTLTLREGGG